jgi:hypothetical protein
MTIPLNPWLEVNTAHDHNLIFRHPRVTHNVHVGSNLQISTVNLMFPCPHHNGGQPIVPVHPAHRFLQRVAMSRHKQGTDYSMVLHRLRPQSLQILARATGQRVIFVPKKSQDVAPQVRGQCQKQVAGAMFLIRVGFTHKRGQHVSTSSEVKLSGCRDVGWFDRK